MAFLRKCFLWVLGVWALLFCGAPAFPAFAAGVIDDAPTFATAFLRMLDFLLEIFGFLVILMMVVSGILYFTAGGSQARLEMAKKSSLWAIIGVIVGLGALVLVRALARFFE